MSDNTLSSIEQLKKAVQRLPGVGARSADRIAFHILRESAADARELADAIMAVKENVGHCSRCFNLTETDPCAICTAPGRDHGELWVVEQPKDVTALESVGLVHGVYHVLMGHIAPLEGVEPHDLTIEALLERVKKGDIREVIIATNPTMEGDGTALHIHSLLEDTGVRVSRPSRGLAVGSPLEYASPAMIEAAVRGRTAM